MFRESPREGRPFREAKRVRFPFSSTNYVPKKSLAEEPAGLFAWRLEAARGPLPARAAAIVSGAGHDVRGARDDAGNTRKR